MSDKFKVTCPHCGNVQEEPMGAISTYCRSCKQHIPIKGNRKRKAAMVPQNTRVVICRECGYTDKIVSHALSTQCENCSAYLDMRNHVIQGKSGQKLVTYGDVTFMPGSTYEGPLVRASKITVAGKVSAILQADVELEIQTGAKVSNPIQSPLIKIAPGAEVIVGQINTRCLELASKLRANTITASEQLIILPTGILMAQQIYARFVEVQPGGVLVGDLTVEPGEVVLDTAPPAESSESTEEEDPKLA
ncbi:MAG: hypothetical protein B9S32_15280 [Verrucomicrobia bacterium Tous-C9LFEB]|nr:MAG: hypothetical protein B9S32_15280 [Verrucomicrobia bacterium Tous-C9LFEB]